MIEILRYEKASKNKIIGYVDIKIKTNEIGMIIRNIAHLQSEDKRWFSLPSCKRTNADGTEYYTKIWEYEFDAYNKQLLEQLKERTSEYLDKLDSIPF